ncbi:MAG TPA: nucleotidyltransferase domain-containing protein [Candidatus Hydrogenedentes bacterium]|nr:nucleotidyltransferase domain-containing protein [Candidatus Hydrogenedentota bacterium]
MNTKTAWVVKQIAETIHPTKVILFGSRASHRFSTQSDIDLLVIYDGDKSKRDVKLAIHRLFEHPTFSLDVFVLSSAEFEQQAPIANTLAREVAEHGVVSYG